MRREPRTASNIRSPFVYRSCLAESNGENSRAEVQNVREESSEEGQRLVGDMGRIAVETVSCRVLAEDAHALANATGRTVYDCMYLALAVRLNTRSITADDRLEAGLRSFPEVATYIQLIQTFEPSAAPGEQPEKPE